MAPQVSDIPQATHERLKGYSDVQIKRILDRLQHRKHRGFVERQSSADKQAMLNKVNHRLFCNRQRAAQLLTTTQYLVEFSYSIVEAIKEHDKGKMARLVAKFEYLKQEREEQGRTERAKRRAKEETGAN